MTVPRLRSIAAIEQIARVAFFEKVRAQLGVPYVWGGTSPTGFDCSGLVQWAAASAGITGVPRTANDQFQGLPGVNSPRAGDLVFFAGSDGTLAQPGHVGICMNKGCTTMINAPYTGDAVEVDPVSAAGTVAGYRSVVGGASSSDHVVTTPPATTPAAKKSGTGCNAKPNVFGTPGLPLVHTGSVTFTACEAKALLGGLCVFFGGFLMLAGVGLIAVYGLDKTAPKSTARATGALKGAVKGPSGALAGAATATPKAAVKPDADDIAYEADRDSAVKDRDQRRWTEMKRTTSHEGAPRRGGPVSSSSRHGRHVKEPVDF